MACFSFLTTRARFIFPRGFCGPFGRGRFTGGGSGLGAGPRQRRSIPRRHPGDHC